MYRNASVDISDVLIGECKLSDSAVAPLIVGPDSVVTLRSVSFVSNANTVGASCILAMAGSSIAIEDSEFRDNKGFLGPAILDDVRRLTVSASTFAENRANGLGEGGGVFRIQVSRMHSQHAF